MEDVWGWLDAVPDPEIPVISLVDLGVIREIAWEGERLAVTVTPTYAGCPASSVIGLEIERALARHGVKNVLQKRQLAPPWTSDWISAKGREALAAYGIAPPTDGGPQACPHCGGARLSRISEFGSTPCKAQWRCDDCLEPFEFFKCI